MVIYSRSPNYCFNSTIFSGWHVSKLACWSRDSRGNNLGYIYINGSSGSNSKNMNKFGGKDNRIFVIFLVELAENKCHVH